MRGRAQLRDSGVEKVNLSDINCQKFITPFQGTSFHLPIYKVLEPIQSVSLEISKINQGDKHA